MTPALLTTAEAATELRCTSRHIQRLINGEVKSMPRLPHVRVGRKFLIRRETMTQYLVDYEKSCSSVQSAA